MVNTRDFMDPWTFNVKNVMKCCVEFLVPDGRMIPFCAYNSVGYREQVAASLEPRGSRVSPPIKPVRRARGGRCGRLKGRAVASTGLTPVERMQEMRAS